MLTRRHFVKTSAALIGAPYFIPSTALGKDGAAAPSNRITMATIGCGGRGVGVTNSFLKEEDCRVVAMCDVDAEHLGRGVETVNKKYKNADCKGYGDFRDVLARKDIDAVYLATPDHWHAMIAVAAANAGKDIYGEKPLAQTIREQQAIVAAVANNQRIWQTGSWQRSQFNFRQACELVRNGYLGKVSHIEVGLPAGHNDLIKTGQFNTPTDPPAALDYNFWLGPSRQEPYIQARVHRNWRWNYNTGGGQLMDWIGHHCDIAHWGMDYDATGPVEIEGKGEFPAPDQIFNTATRYRINTKYESGVTMTIAGGHDDVKSGAKWIGDNGWVWVDRKGFEASDKAWIKEVADKEKKGELKTMLYNSPGHERNFLDCIKSRKQTITPVQVAHHSATPGHLGLISMRLGRKIQWDPRKEEIVGDAEAGKRLGREFRAPWTLAV